MCGRDKAECCASDGYGQRQIGKQRGLARIEAGRANEVVVEPERRRILTREIEPADTGPRDMDDREMLATINQRQKDRDEVVEIRRRIVRVHEAVDGTTR